MKSYRHSLPPLDGLIFFEAAARHMSFSAAAAELLVTQTAVSKRIQQLEAHLGVALFQRSGRVLALTEEGRKLSQQTGILLDFAESALASITARPETPVRIAANSAVSMFWLSPLLRQFGLSDQASPVELVISDMPAALHSSDNDIAILHGTGNWPGRIAVPLFPDVLVPVISPQLATQMGIGCGQSLSLIAPETRPPLLNFPRVTPEWTNWDNWDNAQSMKGWQQVNCGTYARSVGAALEGKGIALASPFILAAELKDGQLMQLSPIAQSAHHAYYITQTSTRSITAEAICLLGLLSRRNERS
jgi:LysR family glycine cleavage system transcriptional activator